MSEAEKVVFHVVLGMALFIVGYEMGRQGKPLGVTSGSNAADPYADPSAAWFNSWGGWNR